MKHAEEPWEVREVDGMVAICGADRWVMDEDPAHDRDFNNLADAKRIAACVNVCEGLTNEELRDIANEKTTVKQMLSVVLQRYQAAEAKVRELSEVLRGLAEKVQEEITAIEHYESWTNGSPCFGTVRKFGGMKGAARAALAKLAEGERDLHGTV